MIGPGLGWMSPAFERMWASSQAGLDCSPRENVCGGCGWVFWMSVWALWLCVCVCEGPRVDRGGFGGNHCTA